MKYSAPSRRSVSGMSAASVRKNQCQYFCAARAFIPA